MSSQLSSKMSLRREAASDEEASEEERFQSGAEDASDGVFSDSEAEEEPAPAVAPQQGGGEELGSPRESALPLHTLRPSLFGRLVRVKHRRWPWRGVHGMCTRAAAQAIEELISDRLVFTGGAHWPRLDDPLVQVCACLRCRRSAQRRW